LRAGVSKNDTDHINQDKLDNRKANLRIVTHQQNMTNQKVRKNQTGIKGVYKVKSGYVAKIKANYQLIHLGTYATLSEAQQARKLGEIKYWGCDNGIYA